MTTITSSPVGLSDIHFNQAGARFDTWTDAMEPAFEPPPLPIFTARTRRGPIVGGPGPMNSIISDAAALLGAAAHTDAAEPNATRRDPGVGRTNGAGSRDRRFARAASRALHASCLLLLSFALGCGAFGGGGGGSSSSGGVAEAVIAVDPVDLPPGATQAQLAWAPSDGPVDGYFVFVSRNDSSFAFSHMVPTAETQISGDAGDSVRITVVAVTPNGDFSESSPPSPPVRFHPAEAQAQLAVAWGGAGEATATASATHASEPGTGAETTTEDLASTDARSETAEAAAEDASADDSELAIAPIDAALRALLLRAGTRLPGDGLSDLADRWLQDRVDVELAAGVSLVGTGTRNDDALRELVWQDQSGQLFVSDGHAALDSEDLPSTFEEAVRLHATERFRGLADFDGDGVGDWLIEDTATGVIWLVDGAQDRPDGVAADPIGPEARLAGHGDFDGDGRAELLWIGADRRIDLSRPGASSAEAPLLDGDAFGPEGFEPLAIADLDGDGRDDLLGRLQDGSLAFARTLPSETADGRGTLAWQLGPPASTSGLELLATLDLDEDGAAEIAWLEGDALQIWDGRNGPE